MKRYDLIIGVLFFCSSMSLAQTKHIYHLDSLVAAALTNDEQTQILNYEKKKTELDRKKLNTTFFPQLDFNGIYNHQSEVAELSLADLPFPVGTIRAGVYDQYDFSMQLRALLFDGFSRIHQHKLLNTNIAEQNYRLEYRRQEIKFQVYSLSLQYLYKLRSLEALNNSLDRLQLQRKRVKALFDQGFASSIDTLDLSSRINEIKLQQISLKSSIDQSLHELELVSGMSQIDSVVLGEEGLNFSELDKEALFSKLMNNFDLRLLSFQNQKLTYLKKQQYAAYFPKMYLAFAYHYGKPGVNFFQDKWMDYWTVGLQFSWNLWSWGRDNATLRQSNYSLHQLELQQQLLERAGKSKIKKFLRQIDELKTQQKLLEKMISEKQEKYELMKKRWEQGLQTTLDVLNAEKELTNTEMKKSLVKIQEKITFLLLNKEVGFSL